MCDIHYIIQSNPITCTCSSADKRWLVTADIGKDCLVSIWDSYSGYGNK